MVRTIAITGSSGWLGRSLCRRLYQPNLALHLLRHSNSAAAGTTFDHLEYVAAPKVITFERYLHENHSPPDVVVYLAWSDLHSFDDTSHLDQVNLHFANIRKLIERGVRRLIVAGTCLEYGKVEGELEEHKQLKPLLKYARGKVHLYEKLLMLREEFKFSLTWCRIFYAFGADRKQPCLYNDILAAAQQGKSFAMSAGTQRRDFIHIDEIAAKLETIINSPSAICPDVVNIGSGYSRSVNDMAQMFIEQNKLDLKIHRGALSIPWYEGFDFWASNKNFDKTFGSRDL